MLLTMKIGKNLRKLREEKGLSLRDLQNEVGISHNTLGAYERDTVQPTIENYFKLIDYFEIPFSYLVYGKQAIEDFIDSELKVIFKNVEKLKKEDREIIKRYIKKYLKAKLDLEKLQEESS
jgi:transcriptional regulator with XRE-family HTH domain